MLPVRSSQACLALPVRTPPPPPQNTVISLNFLPPPLGPASVFHSSLTIPDVRRGTHQGHMESPGSLELAQEKRRLKRTRGKQNKREREGAEYDMLAAQRPCAALYRVVDTSGGRRFDCGACRQFVEAHAFLFHVTSPAHAAAIAAYHPGEDEAFIEEHRKGAEEARAAAQGATYCHACGKWGTPQHFTSSAHLKRQPPAQTPVADAVADPTDAVAAPADAVAAMEAASDASSGSNLLDRFSDGEVRVFVADDAMWTVESKQFASVRLATASDVALLWTRSDPSQYGSSDAPGVVPVLCRRAGSAARGVLYTMTRLQAEDVVTLHEELTCLISAATYPGCPEGSAPCLMFVSDEAAADPTLLSVVWKLGHTPRRTRTHARTLRHRRSRGHGAPAGRTTLLPACCFTITRRMAGVQTFSRASSQRWTTGCGLPHDDLSPYRHGHLLRPPHPAPIPSIHLSSSVVQRCVLPFQEGTGTHAGRQWPVRGPWRAAL